MAGEEAVEGTRTRHGSRQVETHPGNEEEQEQETPQGDGRKINRGGWRGQLSSEGCGKNEAG